MSKRVRKVVLALLLTLSLTSIGVQMASAGSPIRCGDRCASPARSGPPPQPGN